MTIIVPHQKTKQEVIGIVDRGASDLFAAPPAGGIQIVDQTKAWQDSTMTFSLKGKMGFISVPLSGTVEVQDRQVVVNCELPAMLKNFIGEDKVRSIVDQKVKGLLAG